MRFTVDLDRFFDFLTRFSLILRFQPILPLQNSRGPKTVIFLTFCGFFDIGKRLWMWLWTRIRFSHQRPGKIQAKDSIWCLVDVFLTVFEAFWWAFRADMQKSEEKTWKKVEKGQKIKKFKTIFYRCRNTFYDDYRWFGPFFRLFDPIFFNF